ncbi:MAG: methyl-accepting chemotaxis protein, partial [Sulfurospirillaceae bacterium]|nr:methyl-accepting chemotaxis protein [Sulfurospirillaceae bacterium]MDX1809855.1 methyl-accepting chemotaxis protein [Sulfurospirillaceae bacterium]
AATDTSDSIERSYNETQKDVDEIFEQVSKINDISTQNARSTEEIASAAEHLNAMTETLNNKLSEFRT